MAKEIERKFLVSDLGAARASFDRPGRKVVQGYLNLAPARTVRVRVVDDVEAWLTVKGRTEGVSRDEFEYAVPVADALQMLGLCEGSLVTKTRLRPRVGAHVWDVDIFEGDNAGLVVAEIELTHADEAFERPAWLGEEVSGDRRFVNSALATRPFCQWPPAARA